jgi:C-terminal processing protease CtpA/Prc
LKRNLNLLHGLLMGTLMVGPAAAQPVGPEIASRALEAYQKKDYARSAELFEAAMKYGDPRIDNHYNAACSYALTGQKEKAFEILREAVDLGFYQAEHIRSDSDLQSLRQAPRWPALLAKAEANLASKRRIWDESPLNTAFREELSEDEKIAGLSKLWSEVKLNFANFDLVPEVDWDALYLQSLPRVRQAKTTREYYQVLQEVTAALHDGHTNVFTPAELADELYGKPLIATRWIEGRVLVSELLSPEPQRAGIVPGLEVVAVDGVPVEEYARRQWKPRISASTPQDLQVQMFERLLLAGPVSRPVELRLRDARGGESVKALPRVSRNEWQDRWNRRRPAMVLRRLPGNVLHLVLNHFEEGEAAQLFASAFPEISKASGLVLDVRENGGGESSGPYRILGYLTDRPHVVERWRTRSYQAVYRALDRMDNAFEWGEFSLAPVEEAQPYHGPVVMLIGPRTYSSAEEFAVAFDSMDRGLLIGEPTGGSSGQPLVFSLPGGGSARVCTRRDTYLDGREFVGVGVQPDRAVRPTITDFRAGRDTVLEAALAEIAQSSKATGRGGQR